MRHLLLLLRRLPQLLALKTGLLLSQVVLALLGSMGTASIQHLVVSCTIYLLLLMQQRCWHSAYLVMIGVCQQQLLSWLTILPLTCSVFCISMREGVCWALFLSLVLQGAATAPHAACCWTLAAAAAAASSTACLASSSCWICCMRRLSSPRAWRLCSSCALRCCSAASRASCSRLRDKGECKVGLQNMAQSATQDTEQWPQGDS